MNTLRTSKKRRVSGGFTLIEIMLVLAIIAMLLGVGIMKLTGVTDKGRRVKVKADFSALRTALLSYQTDAGTYPTTEQGLDALITKPSGVRSWSPSLDGEILDPWKNSYGYRYPPTKNKPGKPDIFSKGEDGIEGTADDINNWDPDN